MHSACAQRSSGRTDEPQSAQINRSSLTFDFASALVLKCATSPRSSWRCFRNCFRPDVAGSASPLPLHLLQFLLRPLHEQSRPERLTSLLQLQELRRLKPCQICLPVGACFTPSTSHSPNALSSIRSHHVSHRYASTAVLLLSDSFRCKRNHGEPPVGALATLVSAPPILLKTVFRRHSAPGFALR
jgi:hypothetical protein